MSHIDNKRWLRQFRPSQPFIPQRQGKCENCGATKKLTKHHMLKGTTMVLCRECHNMQHGMNRDTRLLRRTKKL